MTAVVGILNKRGIAIAADSAVTFPNADKKVAQNQRGDKIIFSKDKVINSGDKMLRLKDRQPVAVMIVGCALLRNLPWDIIIRWYRKQSGSSGFPKFQEYIDHFKEFVESDIIPQYIRKDYIFTEVETTKLVFAGYGEDEPFPCICQYTVTGVENGKLQWSSDACRVISDKVESTIFTSGKSDIIDAIELGIQNKRIAPVYKQFQDLIDDVLDQAMFSRLKSKIDYAAIRNEIKELIAESGRKQLHNKLNDIAEYDLQKMACLAENLIKATELHRKISFQQEEVGGLVDLAVITKNDGFQWLNRKSWYEPSKGGRYGKFGI